MSTDQTYASNPDDRLDAIIESYLRAIESGVAPDEPALLAAHPDLAPQLMEFFASRRSLENHARPIREAISSATSAQGTLVRYFGDYELLEEIARGGMGIVFKARQVSLKRIVALKMILSGNLASQSDVERFYAEAGAAAQLDHPGIVPIYEIGQHEGQHFFSMAFVDSESLAAKVAKEPLPPREAAEMLKSIAEAVQYAHERGVIHRDLKPGNLLLDRSGQPRITDFGLAKRVEGDSNLTATGQIVGTPSYMPPEQAQGNGEGIGPASDIYSLGAVLYCLITGRPPFQAANPLDTLFQVLEKEPVAPRLLNPAIPRDMETICLKCLEKAPARRYATARDFAEELRRFLSGDPIAARRAGNLERGWRWSRRHPARAGLLVASAVIIVAFVAIGVGFGYQRRLEKANDQLSTANKALSDTKGQLEKTNAQLTGANGQLAGMNQQLTEAQKTLEQAHDTLGHIAYADKLMLAQSEFDAGNGLIAQELLDECETKYRGWEWNHLHLKFHEHEVTSSPPSNLDEIVTDEERLAIAIAWTDGTSPDGHWQISPLLRLTDTYDGKSRAILQGLKENEYVRHVVFSPDGQRIAAAFQDGTIRLWDSHIPNDDVYAGPMPEWIQGGDSPDRYVFRQEFDGGSDTAILLAGSYVFRMIVFVNDTQVAESTPDNQMYTVLMCDIQKHLRNEKNIVKVQVFSDSPIGSIIPPTAAQVALKLALRMNDGSMRYVVTDKSWQAAQVVDNKLPENAEWLPVTSSRRNAWQPPEIFIQKVAPSAILEGHSKAVNHLAFSADGSRLASASDDETVRVWDIPSAKQLMVLDGHKTGASHVTFAPFGERLASVAQDSVLRLWDSRDAKIVSTIEKCFAPTFSPDGRRLAALHFDQTIDVCSAQDGKLLLTIPTGLKESISQLAFSPDGGRLATASDGKTACIWSARDGRLLAKLQGHFPRIAFSPNGERLVSGGVWDLRDGGAFQELHAHTGPVKRLVFCRNDGVLASAGDDATVRLWDWVHGTHQATLEGHTAPIGQLKFSPDGERLATASSDGTARLWDRRSGKLLAPLEGHVGPVNDVAFSASGLATAGDDKTVRLWNHDGKQIGMIAPGRFSGDQSPIGCIALDPDGVRLASCDSLTIRLWDVELAAGPPAEWIWGGVAKDKDRYEFHKEFDGGCVSATLIATCDDRMEVFLNGVKIAECSEWQSPIKQDVQSHLRPDKNVLMIRASNEGGAAGLALKLALKMDDGSVRYIVSDKSWKAAKPTDDQRPDQSEEWFDVTSFGEMGVGPWDDIFTPRVIGLATLVGGGGMPSSQLTFIQNGGRLLSADMDVYLWDVRDVQTDVAGSYFLQVATGAAGSPMLARFPGNSEHVRFAISPDQRLMASGSDNGIVGLWDMIDLPATPSGTNERGLPPPGAAPFAKPLARMRGHTGPVLDVVFSPDGKYLATAGQDMTVRLWDVRERKALAVLRGHSGAVYQVAFSPDGTCIASASEDGAVRLWFSEDTAERRALREHTWREQQALEAEAAEDWYSAAFHLTELLNDEPNDSSLHMRWEKSMVELSKVDEGLAHRAAARRKE